MANFDRSKNECRLTKGLCSLEKSSNDVLAGFWCDFDVKELNLLRFE